MGHPARPYRAFLPVCGLLLRSISCCMPCRRRHVVGRARPVATCCLVCHTSQLDTPPRGSCRSRGRGPLPRAAARVHRTVQRSARAGRRAARQRRRRDRPSSNPVHAQAHARLPAIVAVWPGRGANSPAWLEASRLSRCGLQRRDWRTEVLYQDGHVGAEAPMPRADICATREQLHVMWHSKAAIAHIYEMKMLVGFGVAAVVHLLAWSVAMCCDRGAVFSIQDPSREGKGRL